jgi:hypothetical protein
MFKKNSAITALLLTFAAAAGALTLLLASLDGPAAAGPDNPALTATPSVTPEATPYVDPFSATLKIAADRSLVAFGEELLVTIDLKVVEGCQYPVLELTLFQDGEVGALFTYIDPPTAVVNVPGSFPYTYRLQAIRSGAVSLRAQTYGERNCNDFWNWHYLSTSALPITVSGEASPTYLPLIAGE